MSDEQAPLAAAEIAEAKRVCAAAAPWPWYIDYGSRGRGISWVSDAVILPCESLDENDAAFIAAARTGWPRALAEVERLRAVVAACHEAIGEAPESDDDTLPEGIRLRVAEAQRLAEYADTLAAEKRQAEERAEADEFEAGVRISRLEARVEKAVAALAAALAAVAKAEEKICDFQAASMIDVGNQGGPCLVEPRHLEEYQTKIHQELDVTKAALAAALECARVRGEALQRKDEALRQVLDQIGDWWEVARAALALQSGDPALAELVAAREDLVTLVCRKIRGGDPLWYECERAVERLDAARRKLGGGRP